MFLIGQVSFAQSAFQNFGNIQIHENAQVGFHTNLINDGTFNNNKGLAGFYSLDDYLVVSGNNKAIFNNLEVDVIDNLYLNTSMGLTNNLSFITGKIVTPRETKDITLDFLNHQIYGGEGDYTHVDGYATVTNDGEFVFPIGDDDAFRPMILPNQAANSNYKGAYFRENPNNPTTFNQSFDTDTKQLILKNINTKEFWDLKGATETTIILTWDIESNISALSKTTNNLRVVGWSKEFNKWVDLGGKNIIGDLDKGAIESTSFIPDNFEIVTIGSDSNIVLAAETVVNLNFGITPNGDGLNDTFVIEGIELRPNNTIYIYNRWGALVYSKKRYDNSWGGIAEHNLTLNAANGLPEGTYFYVLEFHDEEVNWQGWIYLRR